MARRMTIGANGKYSVTWNLLRWSLGRHLVCRLAKRRQNYTLSAIMDVFMPQRHRLFAFIQYPALWCIQDQALSMSHCRQEYI